MTLLDQAIGHLEAELAPLLKRYEALLRERAAWPGLDLADIPRLVDEARLECHDRFIRLLTGKDAR